MPGESNSEAFPIWQGAASFAARAHRHQLRRDGKTPYFAHTVRVMMAVSQVFGCRDEVAMCAALLHDTIEDTTTDYDDLLANFGRDVADCVAALTKNMSLPEKKREAEYDRRLAKADWRARLVKLADVFDNYCDVGTHEPTKVAEKRKDALEKCRRAIALAKKDAANPVMRRAVRAVESLIAGHGG